MDRLIIIALSALALWSSVTPAAAATTPTVLLIGPSRLIRVDDQLAVEIQLDSAGQQINAAELQISYPSDRLKMIRVGREQSIFPVWAEEPRWDANRGTVTFIGGRPRGIIASRATMATLYFTVLRSGPAEIHVLTPSSKVFFHDGQGTPDVLPAASISLSVADPLVGGLVLRSATHPTIDAWSRNGTIDVNWDIESDTLYSYALSQDRSAVPDDNPEPLVVRASYDGLADGVYYFSIKSRTSGFDWSEMTQRRFLLDQTPPEPFEIERIETDAVPGVQLLSWLAVDRTAGVEKYRLLVGGRDQGEVTSPLTLKPSWTHESISIVAVDGAGNRRTSQLPVTANRLMSPLIIGALAAVLVIGGIMLYLGLRARRMRSRAGS